MPFIPVILLKEQDSAIGLGTVVIGVAIVATVGFLAHRAYTNQKIIILKKEGK